MRWRLGLALEPEGSGGGVINISYGMGDPDIVVAWSLVMTKKTATSAPLVFVKRLIPGVLLRPLHFQSHSGYRSLPWPVVPCPRLAAAGCQSRKRADVPTRSCVTHPLINARITHDVPLLTALRGFAQPAIVLASGIWQDMQSRPHVKTEVSYRACRREGRTKRRWQSLGLRSCGPVWELHGPRHCRC
jgi:hypothetical protein